MEFNFFSHTAQENVSVPVINDNDIKKEMKLLKNFLRKERQFCGIYLIEKNLLKLFTKKSLS